MYIYIYIHIGVCVYIYIYMYMYVYITDIELRNTKPIYITYNHVPDAPLDCCERARQLVAPDLRRNSKRSPYMLITYLLITHISLSLYIYIYIHTHCTYTV